MSRGKQYEVQQGPVPSPARWSQPPDAILQDWERMAVRLPRGKKTWEC